MKKVTRSDGVVITDQKEILNEVRQFYRKLFAKKGNEQNIDLNAIVNFQNVTKLTDEQSQTLDGKLTIVELSNALKGMKNEKCPGIDGFPAEFYKVFWNALKFLFCEL